MLRDIRPGDGIKPNGESLLWHFHAIIVTKTPRGHLVSCNQTAAKAVWPRETSLHHCSAHCSKIDKTFDGESRRSANNRHSHLSDESDMLARDQLPDQ